MSRRKDDWKEGWMEEEIIGGRELGKSGCRQGRREEWRGAGGRRASNLRKGAGGTCGGVGLSCGF
jgi:hypothetical protein